MLVLLILIVLVPFLLSFRVRMDSTVLNVYFGVPGSGKTTLAAYLVKYALKESPVIRWCNSHDNAFSRRVLASKYFKRRSPVYSNVPITGALAVDKNDLGVNMIRDGKLIIDEAGVEFNSRNYKSFPKESIYFFKYHRHYKVSVDVFSQSYEDMDVTIRRLAQNFYVVKKSLVPFCICIKKIRRKVGIDDATHQIIDHYSFDFPVLGTKRVFSPPLWKMFNTFACKDLPVKAFERW